MELAAHFASGIAREERLGESPRLLVLCLVGRYLSVLGPAHSGTAARGARYRASIFKPVCVPGTAWRTPSSARLRAGQVERNMQQTEAIARAIDKFRSIVDDIPRAECIEWPLARDRDGYGRITIHDGQRALNFFAHRVAWIDEYGPIPEGSQVRHYRCAEASCVNVRHLELGSASDNARDAVVHREIRRRLTSGETLLSLSREFDLLPRELWTIGTGKPWHRQGPAIRVITDRQ
jgi:HNH endonuclease